jgi:general L-amino acid transport system substrate-binding protein
LVPVTAFERFQKLADDEYDVLIRTTTYTMERNVLEPTTGDSFSFSVPYLYNQLQYAGEPPYVQCADNGTLTGEFCNETKICVLDGTTHVTEVMAQLPDAPLISVVGSEYLYYNFIQGVCNVIAGEQFDIAESIVRAKGYVGEYEYGTRVLAKEPLAFVTRDDGDPQWSDFVNWVLEALLAAEEASVTSTTANIIPPTDAFGNITSSPFAFAFRNAVREVGNYAEIYQRTLQAILPRPIPDQINPGNSGLMYAFPFGNINVNGTVGPGPTPGDTLDTIRTRGFLKCGISRRIIFAQFDANNQTWNGASHSLVLSRAGIDSLSHPFFLPLHCSIPVLFAL